MSASGAGPLALLTAMLVAGAGLVLLQGARRPPEVARDAPLQGALGGLGLGTSLDLRTCGLGFDPRLEGSCRGRVEPLVGGGFCCPRHRGTLPPP